MAPKVGIVDIFIEYFENKGETITHKIINFVFTSNVVIPFPSIFWPFQSLEFTNFPLSDLHYVLKLPLPHVFIFFIPMKLYIPSEKFQLCIRLYNSSLSQCI